MVQKAHPTDAAATLALSNVLSFYVGENALVLLCFSSIEHKLEFRVIKLKSISADIFFICISLKIITYSIIAYSF